MQKASREWAKNVSVTLEGKRTHMMTTNNISLKSHVLTEKDLGLPTDRSPKPRFLLAVLMCRLNGVMQFAQNAVDASFNRPIFR